MRGLRARPGQRREDKERCGKEEPAGWEGAGGPGQGQLPGVQRAGRAGGAKRRSETQLQSMVEPALQRGRDRHAGTGRQQSGETDRGQWGGRSAQAHPSCHPPPSPPTASGPFLPQPPPRSVPRSLPTAPPGLPPHCSHWLAGSHWLARPLPTQCRAAADRCLLSSCSLAVPDLSTVSASLSLSLAVPDLSPSEPRPHPMARRPADPRAGSSSSPAAPSLHLPAQSWPDSACPPRTLQEGSHSSPSPTCCPTLRPLPRAPASPPLRHPFPSDLPPLPNSTPQTPFPLDLPPPEIAPLDTPSLDLPLK